MHRLSITLVAMLATVSLGAVVFSLAMPPTLPPVNGSQPHATANRVATQLRMGQATNPIAQQTIDAAANTTMTARAPLNDARARNIQNNERDLRRVMPLIVAALALVILAFAFVFVIAPLQHEISDTAAELQRVQTRNQGSPSAAPTPLDPYIVTDADEDTGPLDPNDPRYQ